MPAVKIVQGSSLEYSLVPVNESRCNFLIIDKIRDTCYEEVEGLIKGGKFYSVLDNFQEPTGHWSLEILADYETEEPWLLINKRPGDLYYPMSYIMKYLTYNVLEYDIWKVDDHDGPIAVLTDIEAA